VVTRQIQKFAQTPFVKFHIIHISSTQNTMSVVEIEPSLNLTFLN
jgi:hypothetical protein